MTATLRIESEAANPNAALRKCNLCHRPPGKYPHSLPRNSILLSSTRNHDCYIVPLYCGERVSSPVAVHLLTQTITREHTKQDKRVGYDDAELCQLPRLHTPPTKSASSRIRIRKTPSSLLFLAYSNASLSLTTPYVRYKSVDSTSPLLT